MDYLTVSPPTTVDTDKASKIQFFYNLFTKYAEDEERVQKIVNEQFSFLKPKLHNKNVLSLPLGIN